LRPHNLLGQRWARLPQRGPPDVPQWAPEPQPAESKS
jgi:hypothetical protein